VKNGLMLRRCRYLTAADFLTGFKRLPPRRSFSSSFLETEN